uniref:Uncharacterized protein n=2 Tax=Brassica oleracea TaxID=3712 RepID=A0A0D3CGJ4_BRAOL
MDWREFRANLFMKEQLHQLREKIESDYWHVAACSSDLICGASPENLWQEICSEWAVNTQSSAGYPSWI